MPTSTVEIQWNGDEVKRDVISACRQGLNYIGAMCVNDAKGRVHRITSLLQGSIGMFPATDDDLFVVWGNKQPYLDYAIIEEERHPYLQPAADENYSKLTDAIAGYYGR